MGGDMALDDRDYMRDSARRIFDTYGRATSNYPVGHRPPSPWLAVMVVLVATLAIVAGDMHSRGAPLTLRGLEWWLSLWFPG